MNIKMIVSSSIILCTTFLLWLSISRNVQKRYNSKYAVVTGATGGVGEEIVERMLQKQNVIAVGRNEQLLSALVLKHAQKTNKVIPFVFDFTENLSTFAPKFDAFLSQHKIDKQDIGICFSNAGIGEFKQFESTSYEAKEMFMQVNFSSHLAISDYFCKLFLTRKNSKSALIITSSLITGTCARFFALYHTSKTALSALSASLYSEYSSKNIDILAVHPSSIAHTRFMKGEGMKVLDDFASQYISHIGNLWISVTPKDIVNKMLSRVGKVNQTYVGAATILNAVQGAIFGRNLNAYLWSKCTILDRLFTNKVK
ncbi:Reductase [Hexamita inflata]|uniref:Putative n=1 Tax=Hexamita inflata TaxID=28002 RepID=A0AA86PMS9_9EUKA|nr:Reductase [Hexamita inflata]